MRLAGAGVFPIGLSAVLLTHLHSDHITDLNDVITTHWVMTTEPTSLLVVGPVGTKRVVDAVLEMLALDQRYRNDHHADLRYAMELDVREVSPGDGLDVGDARLTVGETDHRPVAPTIGYRVEADGRSLVVAGDGVPCEGLDRLCAGADAYVQTVIRDDLIRRVPVQRLQDVCDYHSTVAQAAQTAARGGVGTLAMTHLVPAPPAGDEGEWRDLAAEHFGGTIVAGPDLTTFAV